MVTGNSTYREWAPRFWQPPGLERTQAQWHLRLREDDRWSRVAIGRDGAPSWRWRPGVPPVSTGRRAAASRGSATSRTSTSIPTMGNGIASGLLELAEAAMREAGHTRAILWTPTDAPARGFYERCGWRARRQGALEQRASAPDGGLREAPVARSDSSSLSRLGEVAQLVEHTTENRGVGSSILPLAIRARPERLPPTARPPGSPRSSILPLAIRARVRTTASYARPPGSPRSSILPLAIRARVQNDCLPRLALRARLAVRSPLAIRARVRTTASHGSPSGLASQFDSAPRHPGSSQNDCLPRLALRARLAVRFCPSPSINDLLTGGVKGLLQATLNGPISGFDERGRRARRAANAMRARRRGAWSSGRRDRPGPDAVPGFRPRSALGERWVKRPRRTVPRGEPGRRSLAAAMRPSVWDWARRPPARIPAALRQVRHLRLAERARLIERSVAGVGTPPLASLAASCDCAISSSISPLLCASAYASGLTGPCRRSQAA